jgi:phage shock protein PspC (stress-responsive transcriptional regulator)
MNKVITINLNGRSYQLEEQGYEFLQKYLKEAESKLAQDTGKEEIMADLEGALAEKCEQYLSKNKSVVTTKEVEDIISQMGPVESESGEETKLNDEKNQPAPKKLYLIAEGAVFRGVCMGLATYFNVDVTLIRILFIIFTILTQGAGILIYIVIMLVVPRATTSEQKAAASGSPYTAQDYIDRAREEYTKFSDRSEWRRRKREWKNKIRQEKWAAKAQYYAEGHPRFLTPFTGILITVLSIIWLFGLVGLMQHGTIFGLILPASVPFWIAILAWFCIYSFVMWPIKAARWHAYKDGQKYCCHHHGFFGSLTWLALIAIAAWATWQYVPSSHPYFNQASLWWQHVWTSIKTR